MDCLSSIQRWEKRIGQKQQSLQSSTELLFLSDYLDKSSQGITGLARSTGTGCDLFPHYKSYSGARVLPGVTMSSRGRTFSCSTMSSLAWIPGIWGSGLWPKLSWELLEKEPVIWTPSYKSWTTSAERAHKHIVIKCPSQMGNWNWEGQGNFLPQFPHS